MERIDEQEMTKNMLSMIREKVITENTSDEEELDSAELSEEQTNFRKAVSPRVDFTGFKIYPNSKNAVFSGKFQNLGGLEWEFTLEDSNGLYISANNVPFSDDTIDVIKKLKGFYDNWADTWAEKLATEYTASQNDDVEIQQTDAV